MILLVEAVGIECLPLTTTVKVQFHECYRALYPVIIWIFIAELPDPGEVCLIQVLLEQHKPVIEYWLGVVFIEGNKEIDDGLLLVQREL